MTIFEQLLAIFDGVEDRLYTTGEIKSLVERRYGTNPASVIPSDYCYNRWNFGVTHQKPIFVRVGSGEYRFIGLDQPYTGLIYGRPRGAPTEQVIGEWVEGKRQLYPQELAQRAHTADSEPVSPKKRTLPLSAEQLDRIYEEYMEILTLEVEEFGCKPTETRHLVGRLGEFYCARKTNGQLAARVNQEGFDVVASNGRRISVKTTAQKKTGFISINKRTLELADDLMFLRYRRGGFEVVYYGDMQAAVDVARTWEDRFELDISKARRLPRSKIEIADQTPAIKT